MAHAIISSARRVRTRRSEVPRSNPGHRGSNEIDNHADTICAGPNWRLLELSGEYCNSPPTTSRKPTFQLRSVPQCTLALPVATQLSSLLTKSYGLATNSTARSLIHTKSVPTDTVFAMTHGTPTKPLGSISTAARPYRCSPPDRTSFSNRTF